MMSLEKSILLVQSNDKKAPNYEELMKGAYPVVVGGVWCP